MLASVIPLRRMPANLTVLDYLIPSELEKDLKPGQLVTIPFRNRDEFAVVHSLKTHSNVTATRLKSLVKIVLRDPIIPAAQLAFLEEIAALYGTPLGFLLKNNLPPVQKRKTG